MSLSYNLLVMVFEYALPARRCVQYPMRHFWRLQAMACTCKAGAATCKAAVADAFALRALYEAESAKLFHMRAQSDLEDCGDDEPFEVVAAHLRALVQAEAVLLRRVFKLQSLFADDAEDMDDDGLRHSIFMKRHRRADILQYLRGAVSSPPAWLEAMLDDFEGSESSSNAS